MKDLERYIAREHIKHMAREADRFATREQLRRKKRIRRNLGAALILMGFLAVAVLLAVTASGAFSCGEQTLPTEEESVEIGPVYEPIQEVVEPVEQPAYSLIIENSTITHYCICQKCCGKDESHPAYGITASGREAEPYVSIAVDPLLIELGSIVYLDFGDGELLECRADDTGSAIAGSKIDLCVTSHEEALQLGVRTATVYVQEVA